MKSYKIDVLDEKGYYHKLKNGLQIFMVPNKKTEDFNFTVTVKYGGSNLYIKDKNKTIKLKSGLAHFLEHQKFVKDKEDYSQIFEKNEAYINAFTSKYYTTYHFYAKNKKEENINTMLDMITTFNSDEKSVLKERGIITEEAQLYEDHPDDTVYNNSLKAVFNDPQNQMRVIGTYDDISTTTVEDLLYAYQRMYVPNNMFIVITGNFKPKEVLELIKNKMNKLEKKPLKLVLKEEKLEVEKNYIEAKKDIEIPKLIFSIKIKIDKLLKEYEKFNIISYILFYINKHIHGSSELNEKLKNKQLINYNLDYYLDCSNDYIVISIIASTTNKDELLEILKEDLKDKELDEKTFNMFKKYFISSYIRQFDDIMELNENIISSVYTYGVPDPHKGLKLKDLNINTYNEIIKKIDLNNYSVSYVSKKKGD